MKTHNARNGGLLLLAVMVAGPGQAAEPDPADFQLIYQGTWIQPDESTIPAGTEGDRIRHGRTLVNETYRYLGANSATPYTGNKLACTNCHLTDGTKPHSGPWVTSYRKYADPGLFSSRTNELRTLPVRINGCMQRSMNGTPLPEDSEPMQSIIAYFRWLDTGIQVSDWRDVQGQGMPGIPDMLRAADPVAGAEIYRDECRTCHGDHGEGRWEEDEQRFRYPALWGPDSFNTGAGMNRIRTAVGFLKHNMPLAKEDLSDAEAWDVMAYILTQQRPEFANHLTDWTGVGPDGVPNWMKKAVDAGYPNYYPRIDGTNDLNQPQMYPESQHKFGPFPEMVDMQQQIITEHKLSNP